MLWMQFYSKISRIKDSWIELVIKKVVFRKWEQNKVANVIELANLK